MKKTQINKTGDAHKERTKDPLLGMLTEQDAHGHHELYLQRLNNEPEYAIKRITLNKFTIELIENPTPAMKRLHAMRWKI